MKIEEKPRRLTPAEKRILDAMEWRQWYVHEDFVKAGFVRGVQDRQMAYLSRMGYLIPLCREFHGYAIPVAWKKAKHHTEWFYEI